MEFDKNELKVFRNKPLMGDYLCPNKYLQICSTDVIEEITLKEKDVRASFLFDNIELCTVVGNSLVATNEGEDTTIKKVVTIGLQIDGLDVIRFPLTNFLPIKGFEPAKFEEMSSAVLKRKRFISTRDFFPQHISTYLSGGRINHLFLKMLRENPQATYDDALEFLQQSADQQELRLSWGEFYVLDGENWKYVRPFRFDFV